jgi:uncharacterized protein (TIGR03382 family)
LKVDLTQPYPTIGWNGRATLIGGSLTDKFYGIGIAQESSTTTLVVGGTTSSPTMPYGPSVVRNGLHGTSSDAFVGKLDLASGAPIWLTYVGGTGTEEGSALTFNTVSQQIVIVGGTNSADFEGAPGTAPKFKNAFVAWLALGTGQQSRAQVFGGDLDDEATSLTVDGAGTTCVGGKTLSPNFPLRNEFDNTAQRQEGFVSFFPAAGGGGWSSFIGGDQDDEVGALGINPTNRLVVGLTTSSSTGLPGTLQEDTTPNTPPDGFLAGMDLPDPTLPTKGHVNDRFAQDIADQDVVDEVDLATWNKTFYANWFGFSDNSGSVKYEVAVGTAEQPEALSPFTSTGTNFTAMAGPFPSITPGTRYYFTVRAEDPVGLTTVARSDGVLVTGTNPDAGSGTDDGGTGGPDGGPDGGMGGPDGGTGGPDGGQDDGGTSPDGGTDGGTGNTDGDGPISPLGWGCASTGAAGVPLILGWIVLVLAARRRDETSR